MGRESDSDNKALDRIIAICHLHLGSSIHSINLDLCKGGIAIGHDGGCLNLYSHKTLSTNSPNSGHCTESSCKMSGKGSNSTKVCTSTSVACLIQSFYSLEESLSWKSTGHDGHKMATRWPQGAKAPSSTEGKSDCISPAALDMAIAKFETHMPYNVAKFINPLTKQLISILYNTSKLAEVAMELPQLTQREVLSLQQHEISTNKRLLPLKNNEKTLHLKFKGLPENAVESKDLINFMSSWLATQLQLVEGVTPLLHKPYSVGAPNNPHHQFPHYIVVSFADPRLQKKFIDTVRINGMFHF